jgi:thiamine pyrophosphate-dependent acetolactate synthase large subunit-like protein
VIFNGGAYGGEHVQLRALGLDPSLSLLAPVEFAQVASSMHARGFTVEQLSRLEDALDSARRRSGVSVIDIRLDPDYIDSVGH